MKTKLLLVLIWILSISYSTYAQTAQNGASQTIYKPSTATSLSDENIKSILGLDSETILASPIPSGNFEGTNYYRYSQTIDGYKVLGGELIVQEKNGDIEKIVNHFKSEQGGASSDINFLQDWANEIVRQQFEDEGFIWNDTTDPLYNHELLYVHESGRIQLCHAINASADFPFRKRLYLVSTQNGALLKTIDLVFEGLEEGTAETGHSGTQQILTGITSEGTNEYILRDCLDGTGASISTRNVNFTTSFFGNTTQFYDEDNNWLASEFANPEDQYALDVHWASRQVINYYNDLNMGLSATGGHTLWNYVNYQNENYHNAFFSGEENVARAAYSTRFDGELTRPEIVAHELTHGVLHYLTEDGLFTENGEPRALNEAIADVMGSVIHGDITGAMNWQIGSIRNLSNPNLFNQPDCYKGAYWYYGLADNGGAHTNGGPLNYWFYLLANGNGGSGTNDLGNYYDVTSIGLENATDLVLLTLLEGVSQDTDYEDFKELSLQVATDRYGRCSGVYNSILEAWYAVGLGNEATGINEPHEVFTSNITSCSAVVNWPISSFDEYKLYYRETGTAEWLGFTTAQNLAVLQNLNPQTSYEWFIEGYCEYVLDETSPIKLFTTTNSCPIAQGLSAQNITPCSADLVWDTEFGQTYTLYYKRVGGPIYTVVPQLTEGFHHFNSLSLQEQFEAYVVSDCGGCTNESENIYFTGTAPYPALDFTLNIEPLTCRLRISWDGVIQSSMFDNKAYNININDPNTGQSSLRTVDGFYNSVYLEYPDGVESGDLLIFSITELSLQGECPFPIQTQTFNIVVPPTTTIQPPTNVTLSPSLDANFNWNIGWEAPANSSYIEWQSFSLTYPDLGWGVSYGNTGSNSRLTTVPVNQCIKIRARAVGCNGEVSDWVETEEQCLPDCLTDVINGAYPICATEVTFQCFSLTPADTRIVQLFGLGGVANWFDIPFTFISPIDDFVFGSYQIRIEELNTDDPHTMRIITTCGGEEYITDTFSFVTEKKCFEPENVTCLAVSQDLLEVTWNDPNTQSDFLEFQYRLMGTEEWMSELVLESPAIIGGLDLLNEQYEFRINSNCTYQCNISPYTDIHEVPQFDLCDYLFDNEFTSEFQYTGGQDYFSNATTYFENGMVIKEGSSLTLTNAVLVFNENTALTIEEGATLELIDCSLSGCPNWLGIDMEANSSDGFRSTLITNSGSIKHALKAIESTDANTNLSLSPDQWEAGIIRCDGTNFINNLVGFEASYSSDQLFASLGGTAFRGCTFSLNNDFESHFELLDEFAFHHHVYLDHSRDFIFEGCAFWNFHDVGLWKELGKGIDAYNAEFDAISNSFRRLYRGVDASVETWKFNGMTLRDNDFDECMVGIHNFGECTQVIYENRIRLGDLTGNVLLDNNLDVEREGIVLNGCGVFQVQDNIITDVNEIDAMTIGIRVRDVIGSAAVIRKNTLNNLEIGNLSNGDNRNSDADNPSEAGLRYICNNNSGNTYDTFVAEFGNVTSQAAVSPEQGVPPIVEGDPWTDAGNNFSDAPADPNDPRHFNHQGDQSQILLNYYGNSTDNGNDWYFTNNIEKIAQGAINQCDPEVPVVEIVNGGGGKGDVIERAEAANTTKHELFFIYDVLLDGGNTEEIQDEVDFAWSDDVWELRQKLLDISPFVSHATLWKLVNRTSTFPHPIAFEVLVANPSILKDNNFMSYLSKKSDPMPEYMISLLYEARDQKTFRKDLTDDITQVHTTEMYEKNKWISYIAETTNNKEEIYEVIASMDCFDCDLLLIEKALDEEDFTEAESLLAGLEDRKIFNDAHRTEEIELFTRWHEVKKDVIINLNGDWSQINDNHNVELKDMTKSFHTLGGKRAMQILNRYRGNEYFTPPAYGVSGFEFRSYEWNQDVLASATVSVYPNPASHILNIELDYSKSMDQPTKMMILNAVGELIEIREITSSVQFVSLDTRQWAAGTYLMQISGKNAVLQTEKIEIIH